MTLKELTAYKKEFPNQPNVTATSFRASAPSRSLVGSILRLAKMGLVLFVDTKYTFPQKALARFRNQRIGILFLFHHFSRISQISINSFGARQYTFAAEENS